jgi:predicted nucleotidyltransferase
MDMNTKHKVYLFGSLAKFRFKKEINDVDIIIKLDKKPIKKYPKYICNYKWNHNKYFKQLYRKYRILWNLHIDVFFTYDFKYYFQLWNKGDFLFWGDLLKPKKKMAITGYKNKEVK